MPKANRKVAVIDIESHNWVDYVMGASYDGENYLLHPTADSLFYWITSPENKDYRIYAHNGGKFDYRFIIESLINSGLKFEIIQNGGAIILLIIKLDTGGTVELCDSLMLMRASLAKITKAMGVKHAKGFIDFNREQFDITNDDHMEYLRDDCLGLYESLIAFSNWGHNKGNLGITLPSMAMKMFRERYYSGPLEGLQSGTEQFIRDGYFGGRTEIFRQYGEDLNYFDFVSLYPSVMIEEMPIGKCVTTFKYKSGYIGFYYCSVDIPKTLLIPPVGVTHEGKLIFPTGKFNAYLSSDDIELLIENNIPYKVKMGYIFTDKEKIFKSYIMDMFDLKSNAVKDGADYFLSKLFMNSLYGKFAQHRMKEKLVLADIDEAYAKGLVPWDDKLGIYIEESESRSQNIKPYLSSYITSLARNKLYRGMQDIGFKEVYYCDTDSIVTTKDFKGSLELGGLEKEIGFIEKGVFLQPKAYALKLSKPIKGENEIIKLKGFNNREGLDYNLFEKALFTGNIELIQKELERFVGFKEQKKRFKNFKFERIRQVKGLRSEYSKRIVTANYQTIAHHINS